MTQTFLKTMPNQNNQILSQEMNQSRSMNFYPNKQRKNKINKIVIDNNTTLIQIQEKVSCFFFQLDTLKAELQNAQKQIKIQLKQIQILQNRQEMLSLDKYGKVNIISIVQLQSQVKKFMDRIKELEQEKKTLININGKQEKKLVELSQDDFIKNRIDQLEQENTVLKQKVIAQSKTERSQSVQIAKIEPIIKPIQLTQKQQELMKEKDGFITQLQTKLQESEKHIKILNNLKAQYDKQINGMAHRIKQLETQLIILTQQLQEKNCELNRKNYLLPNLSIRNQRYQKQKINLSVDNCSPDQSKNQLQLNYQQYTQVANQLQPKSQQSQKHSSQTQRSEKLVNKEPQNQDLKIIRIEQVGYLNQSEFYFDTPKYFRLHNLKLWWKNDHLYGLQAYYHNANQIVNGQIFCLSNLEELNPQLVELNQLDWINQIGFGFEKEKIKFVKIISNQSCVLKFGCEMEKIEDIQFAQNEILGTIEVSFNECKVSQPYLVFISSIGFKIFDEKLLEKV